MSYPTRRLFVPRSRFRRRRSLFPRILFLTGALGVAALAGLWAQDAPGPVMQASVEPVPEAAPLVVASAGPYRPLLDPGFSLGPVPLPLGQSAPLGGDWQRAEPASPASVEPAPAAEPPAAPVVAAEAAPPALPEASRLVAGTPLPLPRPAELALPKAQDTPRVAERRLSRRMQAVAAVQPKPEDNRSFFEKLFGAQPSSKPAPALAYAAPQDDVVDQSRGRRLSPTLPGATVSAQATAIYDISARTVYMPNGDRLEAHSGLGDKMDDPRYVHVRMKGATPPHVYDLKEREALFHGVRAIRLHPVGGSGKIHGRAGLLAHTYLLGPRGDSNGCVSFKDYEKFLQAYLRGEVKRLVVVASM
ncbi:DUF2778 domain-containing protein [Bosea sp. (in: a-proteobacteria)]|jgi:hypothetical protein|uniref:DUF2778 domain-containing protein n=1 Tax=Bosea sp. (in: a-proteobacteria) TaxID=1871050 RepID=UPI003F72856B